jgi:hypothetical protein
MFRVMFSRLELRSSGEDCGMIIDQVVEDMNTGLLKLPQTTAQVTYKIDLYQCYSLYTASVALDDVLHGR